MTGKNFLSKRLLKVVLEFGFGPRSVSITSGSATLATDIVIGPASCLEGDPADQSANAKRALYTPTEDPMGGKAAAPPSRQSSREAAEDTEEMEMEW